MCGIMGYTGQGVALPILLAGLKRLEYRGYDSAGIALQQDGQIEFRKRKGKIDVLEEILRGNNLGKGISGIGHTRWATHGRPSDENAHPHADCSARFAVVHNGIIENFSQLRQWLASEGHEFRSETDTEVIPHLIEHFYSGDLYQAVRQAVAKLSGSYALAAICCDEPGRIVAARQDSPLVVGLGQGDNFIASDIPAIMEYTRRAYIMEDGELAVVTGDSVHVTDLAGNPVRKQEFEIGWDPVQAEKGGYAHFMLKEIFEQPRAIRDTLSGRLDLAAGAVDLQEVRLEPEVIRSLKRVHIVACGTAYHAGLMGKRYLEGLVRIPVEVDVASEYRYRDPLVDEETLLVIISQSGETADTLAALREGKRRGARVVAITNVVASSVAREAENVIYTWAGPEIAVASTKAYTTQIVSLALLALQLAQLRGTLGDEPRARLVAGLAGLPRLAEQTLAVAAEMEGVARRYAGWEDIFFIGRGLDYALALEGQLKLKEISYIHAEAYAAGELKHGTLALIEEGIPVIALATQRDLLEKTISNITEVKARGAHVTAIAAGDDEEIDGHVDQVLRVPAADPLLVPVLAAIPLQLLAYYAAVARGCDVDKPRNLAKSVTVE